MYWMRKRHLADIMWYTIHCHDGSVSENHGKLEGKQTTQWHGMGEVVACRMVLVVNDDVRQTG